MTQSCSEDDANVREYYPLYSGVGRMKKYLEELCEFYREKYDMDVLIVRPANMYGPNDKFHGGGHVIPMLIKKAFEETVLEVWGDGNTIRDFTYVDDIARIILRLIEIENITAPINVSCSEQYSIAQAAKIVQSLYSPEKLLVYSPSKPNAIPYRVLNTNRLKSLIGDYQFTLLKEGLEKTIQWYKENYTEEHR